MARRSLCAIRWRYLRAKWNPGASRLRGIGNRKHARKIDQRGAPATVVVYRDGRREEISDYTIADGILYLHGNDWQSGYWTKRIPLSALDPIGTMRANRQRGVKFMLPSAPNVVIASF